MRRTLSFQIDLLAQDAVEAPKEFRIFKAGANATTKGTVMFSERAARACADAFAEYGNDLSIDYNHAILSARFAPNPEEAGKAAGWCKLSMRDGECWATDVTWTPSGERRIREREYRYVSPVVELDEDGTALAIVNVSLTNIPATKGAHQLVASRETTDTQPEPHHMETLLLALSLQPKSTEAQALSAVEALKSVRTALLSLTGKTSHEEALGVVTAWKASAEKVVALSAELDGLKAAGKRVELESLVASAIEAKKFTPAQKEHLMLMGQTSLDTLKGFIEASPVMGIATPSKEPKAGEEIALSETEVKVALAMGQDLKAFARTKALQAK